MQKCVVALLVIGVLGCACPAYANTPDSPQQKLAILQKVLANESADNAKYRAATKEAAKILKDLQDKLIKQTATLQETERAVQALQEKQNATQQAVTNLQNELTQQHAKLARLLMAAQRLQRVPPEAMLLRPGEPIDAARTNLLLQRATPEIATQAQDIKDDLDRLARLQQDLTIQSETLNTLRAKQEKQQTALTRDIKTREAFLGATKTKAEQSDAKIAELQKQQSNLKSILADLAKRQQTLASQPAKKTTKPHADRAQNEEPAEEDQPHSKSWGQSLLSFFRSSGPSHMPITGQIRTGYDDKLASGARSQGLYITGSPSGIVTAPKNGTIRFAGPFRQYRLLVIIEHAGGYHSLLGGLHEVYPQVGDSVKAGEPIGKLEGDAAHANLYYEVRQSGKPVDPRALRG